MTSPPPDPDSLPPPTYTEATTNPFPRNPTTTTTNSSPTTTTSLPLPSPLTTHLRTLPARLRATQLARQTVQAASDFDLTALIVPHIEAFLADLTAMVRTPPLAELTLVPAPAVPAGCGMSGAVERRREGEVVRVGRVAVGKLGGGGGGGLDDGGKGGGDGGEAWFGGDEKRRGRETADRGWGDENGEDKWKVTTKEFGEWGRFETDDAGEGSSNGEKAWWFGDEEMAGRLAMYLRPEPNLERKHVRAVVAEPKRVVKEEKSGWSRWGFGGKKAAEPRTPLVPPLVSSTLPPQPPSEDDSVTMTVRAEEVTFRKENDFGVWESMTGWGIVVRVTVKP
jgi:hypothetical protein